MKKLSWFVLVLCVSAFAIGCGGDDAATTDSGSTESSSTEGTEDAGN